MKLLYHDPLFTEQQQQQQRKFRVKCTTWFIWFWFLVFGDKVSLCSPGYPGTYSVEQAGLELRDPRASASQVLGLKACTTTSW